MAALIKFTQGGTAPAGGVALDGVTGTQVSAANTDDTGVASRAWYLYDVPPGSALAVGSLGTAATATFTPDVAGAYLLKLTTTDAAGVVSFDFRVVTIKNAFNRRRAASFALALLETSHNFLGQARGWAPFVEGYLDVIDRIREWAATAPARDGVTVAWDAANSRWAPNPQTQSVQAADGSVDLDNVLAPVTTTGTGANVLFGFTTTSGRRYYVSGFLECSSGSSTWFYEFKATFDNIGGTLTQRSVTVTQLYGTNTTPVVTVPANSGVIQLVWSGLAGVKVKGRFFLHEGLP